MTPTHCKRGHSFDEVNTRWYTCKGHRYRHCRKCQAIASRLRYRNNDGFRESKKQKELARYYAGRQAAAQHAHDHAPAGG